MSIEFVLHIYPRSDKDNSYYYGPTSDIETRIKTHNSGKVRYTKGRRPYRLHYFEMFESRKEAVTRELFFKSIEGYRWLKNQKII